jgi:hypothetical protein
VTAVIHSPRDMPPMAASLCAPTRGLGRLAHARREELRDDRGRSPMATTAPRARSHFPKSISSPAYGRSARRPGWRGGRHPQCGRRQRGAIEQNW